MTGNIAWISSRFDQVGGGERLIQEGLRYYREAGREALIVTWSYNEQVSFNGEYAEPRIRLVNENGEGKNAKRAIRKLLDIPKIRRILREEKIDLVFVQSEYDIIIAWLATLLMSTRVRFLIFGQMFQFPDDYAKYSLIFRRHLRKIVSSRPGYRETISLETPKLAFIDRAVLELICIARYFAVRAADKCFAFSGQVAWETQLLFGRLPTIARGAYRCSMIGRQFEVSDVLIRAGLDSKRIILSASRLVPKKRVDLIIRAFSRAELDDFHLVIAGTGPELQHLKMLASHSPKRDRIHFVGQVHEKDLMPLKCYARLFVSMDIGDYDISPLEALVVGTPIILPTDFDADDDLRRTEGVRICQPTIEALALEMTSAVSTRAKPSMRLLNSFTWEQYFQALQE